MNVITRAWRYKPVRLASIIAGVTAATLFLLPGLRLGGGYTANRFLPHATCYLRDANLIWLNVIGDSLIAIAYLAISGILGYIVYRARHDIPFHWMFGAFGLFIVACGFTHVMGVITVWRPYYWLAADVKAVTAVASVATAVILPFTVPRVFAMIHDAKVADQNKRDLEIAHEKLKESEELKSQFFANVSHELRTPLSLIMGPIRQQLASATLTAEQRTNLEVVERNAGLLLQQVNNLLDLAKLEAGGLQLHYAPTNLAGLMRLVASYFEVLAADHDIEYVVEAPEALPAEVDTDKIQRVILNLLSNAFKFTPDGGSIRCTVDSEDGEAVIVIQDSGAGIPEHLREVVFERFRQIDGGSTRRTGGTGLGLAIVKEFVDLHGGSLDLDSSESGGTRIEVRLPLQAPPGTPVSEAPAELDPESGRADIDKLRSYAPSAETSSDERDASKPLVLVVEDNPDMNTFIAGSLRPEYRVATAFNGVDGIAQARSLRPDLIVSDIMMPRMSGDEMIEQLRQDPDLRDVPIVVLTAKADDQQRVELLEGSVQDHLTKPFQPEELLARVSGLIARRKETIDKLREMNASLERRVAERTEQVEEQAQQLRLLASDLSTTEQRERRRLAQGLHDHLQQLLVAAKLGLEHVALTASPEAHEHIGRVKDALEHSIQASRTITLELYPPVLYDRGLAAALAWAAAQAKRQHGLEVNISADPAANPADQDLQAFLFTSVKELLLNVVKHGQTNKVDVKMELADGMAAITVSDHGVGCDSDVLLTRRGSDGFGLFNIRERLSLLGGRMTVVSAPDKGCSIRIDYPLK
jgi:signal transduction histidine kinase